MNASAALCTVPEAQKAVLSAARTTEAISLPLDQSLNDVLAESVCCDVDFPPFDRATMDGYAVRCSDVSTAGVTLNLVGQIAAGDASDRTLGDGEALQINTGAPVPPGADAVIQVERTKLSADGQSVYIDTAVSPGRNVTPRGHFAQKGQVTLRAGVRLTSLEIATAATCGASELRVHRRPTVAFFSTGNELVDVADVPKGAAIRDSNRSMLSACVTGAGGLPRDLGRAVDDRESLATKVAEGFSSDVLCLTGGISMGAFDFVPEVLADAGVEFLVRKVAVKPGKPVIIGRSNRGGMVFGLPGNPVSAFVCFHLFVAPAIRRMRGLSERDSLPSRVKAVCSGRVPATVDRQSYWPARHESDEVGQFTATPLDWKGSGDPLGMTGATCLVERKPESAAVEPGETVDVMMLVEP
jgi:molybdopterin molybdotransferase